MSDHQSSPATQEKLEIRIIAWCDKVKALRSVLEGKDTGVLCAEQVPSPPGGRGLPSASTADEALRALLQRERLRASIEGNRWCVPADHLCFKLMAFGSFFFEHAEQVASELEGHPSHGAGCRCPILLPLLCDSILPANAEFMELLDAAQQLAKCQHRQP